jgi:preprotein translocase subunit YajC
VIEFELFLIILLLIFIIFIGLMIPDKKEIKKAIQEAAKEIEKSEKRG